MADENEEGANKEDDSEDVICGINYGALREIFFFKNFFYDDEYKKEGKMLYEHVNKALVYTSWMFIIEAVGFLMVYSML